MPLQIISRFSASETDAGFTQRPKVWKRAAVRSEVVPTIEGALVHYETVPFAIVHQWTYIPALRALAEES